MGAVDGDGVLERVRRLGLVDDDSFNKLASAAARRGSKAIPDLMVAARDGSMEAQLCAIKALGMMRHPTAAEALRRISLLELDLRRGRILRAAHPRPPTPFHEPWNVLDVANTLLQADWETVAQEKELGKRARVLLSPTGRMTRPGMRPQHLFPTFCTLPLCVRCRPRDREAVQELYRAEHKEELAEAAEREKVRRREHPERITVGQLAKMILACCPAVVLLPVVETFQSLDMIGTWIAGLVVVAMAILFISGGYAGGRGSTAQYYPPSKRAWLLAGVLCLPQLGVDVLSIAARL